MRDETNELTLQHVETLIAACEDGGAPLLYGMLAAIHTIVKQRDEARESADAQLIEKAYELAHVETERDLARHLLARMVVTVRARTPAESIADEADTFLETETGYDAEGYIAALARGSGE